MTRVEASKSAWPNPPNRERASALSLYLGRSSPRSEMISTSDSCDEAWRSVRVEQSTLIRLVFFLALSSLSLVSSPPRRSRAEPRGVRVRFELALVADRRASGS